MATGISNTPLVYLRHPAEAFPHTFGHWASYGRFKLYDWIERVGTHIGWRIRCARESGNGAFVILNAPPRHGKSELMSKWLPLWFLNQWPDREVILASYGAELATHFGRWVRSESRDNPRVGVEISPDSKAAGRWNTSEGGGMLACGVAGPLSGRGFHLGLIDDPLKNWEDAYSSTVRQKQIEWFQSTFITRAEPGACVVMSMTRWHEMDLAGWAIGKNNLDWEVIRCPAIAEPGDWLGRKVGEPLCPERFDVDDLAAKRRASDEPVWLGLYQQVPSPVGAGRAYEKFRPDRNIDKSVTLRDDLPLHLSLDFNLNPGMHAVIGQYDPRADRFTAVYEIHAMRMNVERCMDAFETWVKKQGGFKWPELQIFGDATGRTETVITSESSYQAVIRKVNRMGIEYRRRVPKKNPPIMSSLAAFNDTLCDSDGQCHYVIHPRCERLLVDMKELRTDDQGLIDKADRELSHASDAERYRVNFVRPLRRDYDDDANARYAVGR